VAAEKVMTFANGARDVARGAEKKFALRRDFQRANERTFAILIAALVLYPRKEESMAAKKTKKTTKKKSSKK
jgi:hypothetical protein